jgi:hypothetical protein
MRNAWSAGVLSPVRERGGRDRERYREKEVGREIERSFLKE